MPLIVDLDEMGYKNLSDTNTSGKNITQVIDDIVGYLVKNCPLLINDIEKNNKPLTLIKNEVANYIRTNKISLSGEESFDEILTRVSYYIWGYGPLQPFINDDDVSDIEVYRKNVVKIKKRGRRKKTNIVFPSEKALINYCYALAIKNEGSLSDINAVQILSDAKSQKNAILRIDICIQPVNSSDPSIVIRRFPKKKKTLDELELLDMFDRAIKNYIIEGVESGLNMVWAGRGGSGKSSLMNACLDFVPEDESQLIMQEAEELFTNHSGTYMQKVKKKYGESDVEYTLKDLTINGLLMSLDRMVIGEIKNEESMEFFNAVYSGHIGWTSVHTPSAKDTPNKIVHLMKYSNTDLSRTDLLEMLSEIDVIIFMKNYKCYEIYEISGFDYEKKNLIWNPVFEYKISKDKDNNLVGNFEKIHDSCPKVRKKIEEAAYKRFLNKQQDEEEARKEGREY